MPKDDTPQLPRESYQEAQHIVRRFLMKHHPDALNITQEERCQYFIDYDSQSQYPNQTFHDLINFSRLYLNDPKPEFYWMAQSILTGHNQNLWIVSPISGLKSIYSYETFRDLIPDNRKPVIAFYSVDDKVSVIDVSPFKNYVSHCIHPVSLTEKDRAIHIETPSSGSLLFIEIPETFSKRDIRVFLDKCNDDLEEIRNLVAKRVVERLRDDFKGIATIKLHTYGLANSYGIFYNDVRDMDMSLDAFREMACKVLKEDNGGNIDSPAFREAIIDAKKEYIDMAIKSIESNITNIDEICRSRLYIV